MAAPNAAETALMKPASAAATNDPAASMLTFRVARGLKVDLFAAEPMVQNIVSFAFDEQGRCYVVESHRRRTSVFDIGNFPEWLEADFSLRTVEDRANFFKRTLTPENQPALDKLSRVKHGFLPDFNGDGVLDWRDLEVESERIRLLVDTNRDGHADVATTFAEGFDGITSGVAAGILARKGEVWFTCIPELWRLTVDALRFTNGLPPAGALPLNPHLVNRRSKIENLIHGFGTHIAYGGHDMHGLKMGPDGKIYFSIADRGISTNLWDRIVDHWPGLTMEALADSGAVFRCNPDGTEFEVVAIGLRNPQELAFDEFGNLFTGDNNSDFGDKSRWEYIVEGADYGWRLGWQWLPMTGAWNSEMLWGMAPSNTSAYYLPPVTHIAAGPAGTSYYPGTGLPARYDRHFFLCDFRGGPNSLVYSFALRPKGASFEAFDESEFIGGFLCTDVDFGLDGAVYVSDWVKGWEKTGQGRIWRVFDPTLVNDPAMLEVRKLLGEGMEERSKEELARLLGHRDMRVRWEAQWELVRRVRVIVAKSRNKRLRHGDETELIDELQRIANDRNRDNSLRAAPILARLAAIQALGEIGAMPATIYDFPALTTRDSSEKPRPRPLPRPTRESPEELLGWHMAPLLLLQDKQPEIRAAVLRMIRRVAGEPANWHTIKYFVEPTLSDPDPQVRMHAANLIGRFRRKEFLQSLIGMLRDDNDRDAYIRHAVVLALARVGDVNALLAAARDESRAVRLGACLALRRLQRAEVAQFLNDADPQIVLEAARAINDVPIPAALPDLASVVSRSSRSNELPFEKAGMDQSLVTSTAVESFVSRRALNANFRLGNTTNAEVLAAFAARPGALETLRIEALELLGQWPKPPARDHLVGLWRPLLPRDGTVAARALESVLATIESNAPSAVQTAAKTAAMELGLRPGEVTGRPDDPERLAKLSAELENGSVVQKQSALAALSGTEAAGALRLLSAWLDKLLAGQVPRELQLDVLEAVQGSERLLASVSTKEKLAKFEAARDSKDALAPWRECLYGGHADQGRKTFIERLDAACFRCHRINGEGGEVGPELAGIGERQSREYILESILFPNAKIAPGFESVLVTLKGGKSYGGVLKSESDTQIVIHSPEDGVLTLKKADIQARDHSLSAMPEGVTNILSREDLRNLVEFLATTSQPRSAKGP